MYSNIYVYIVPSTLASHFFTTTPPTEWFTNYLLLLNANKNRNKTVTHAHAHTHPKARFINQSHKYVRSMIVWRSLFTVLIVNQISTFPNIFSYYKKTVWTVQCAGKSELRLHNLSAWNQCNNNDINFVEPSKREPLSRSRLFNAVVIHSDANKVLFSKMLYGLLEMRVRPWRNFVFWMKSAANDRRSPLFARDVIYDRRYRNCLGQKLLITRNKIGNICRLLYEKGSRNKS